MTNRCRAIVLLALCLASPAPAATLSAVDLRDPRVVVQDDGQGAPETVALFSSEVKRDQNVQNSGGSGHDLFLRNPAGSTIGSSDLTWGASGTTYAWTYSYDGTTAQLTLGNRTIAGNTPGGPNSGNGNNGNGNSGNGNGNNGNGHGNGGSSGTGSGTAPLWNAVSFFLRADDTTRFSSSSVTVTTTAANGTSLSLPVRLSVTNGQQSSPWFALDSFAAIGTLSGTLRFDFALLPGARNSPNSRLSFGLTAQHVTPAEVPVPGAGLSLLGALAGLAAVRRRIVAG